MSLRRGVPNRSVQSQQELRSSEGDRTSVMEDNPHQIALEQLIPAIRQMSRNAVSVDRIEICYYQRKKLGRRCSCFTVETSPDGTCKICHGTGKVGGYTKFGTQDMVLDASACWAGSGVRVDYTKRPYVLMLEDTAVVGEVFTTWMLTNNTGKADLVRILKFGDTVVDVKRPLDTTWVTLTKQNVEILLPATKLDVRLTMRRRNPDDASPSFMLAELRYAVSDRLLIPTDWPIRSQSITLAEYGIYDSWQTVTLYFDDTVNFIDVEDWLINTRDGTRWKVIEVRVNRPLGILTSTEMTARQVQSYEAYSSIPQ